MWKIITNIKAWLKLLQTDEDDYENSEFLKQQEDEGEKAFLTTIFTKPTAFSVVLFLILLKQKHFHTPPEQKWIYGLS